ncbi:unnamed protein product [Sympodiomycopsis kandeliae]
MADFSRLPFEVLGKIFGLLDPSSVLCCQRVNKTFHNVATSAYVLQLICQRAGYLPHGGQLEDLRKPLFGDSDNPDLNSLTYPAYQVEGRKDSEYKDYQSFLWSTYSLAKTKSKANLSFYGGSQWSPFGAKPWRVKIDHLNKCMIAVPEDGGAFWFYDAENGKHLHTIKVEDLPPYAEIEVSHGWIAYSSRAAGDDGPDIFKLWKLERQIQEGQGGKCFPVLTPMGEIEAREVVSASSFKFPELALASLDGYTTVYNVVTREMVQAICVQDHHDMYPTINGIEFDDDFVWIILDCDDAESNEELSIVRAYSRQSKGKKWEVDLGHEILTEEFYSVRENESHQSKVTGRTDCQLRTSRQDSWMLWSAPQTWKDVSVDLKTQSLCLLTESALFVIPDYRQFHTGADGHQRVIGLSADPQAKTKLSYSHLAVSDGIAAYCEEDKLVMVDLAILLTLPKRDQQDDQLCDALTSSVKYYVPPMFHDSPLRSSWSLALTSTQLAVMCISQNLIPEPQNLLESTRLLRYGILSIDFGAMRCRVVDQSRVSLVENEEKGNEDHNDR